MTLLHMSATWGEVMIAKEKYNVRSSSASLGAKRRTAILEQLAIAFSLRLVSQMYLELGSSPPISQPVPIRKVSKMHYAHKVPKRRLTSTSWIRDC